jgi:hypothetical protein
VLTAALKNGHTKKYSNKYTLSAASTARLTSFDDPTGTEVMISPFAGEGFFQCSHWWFILAGLTTLDKMIGQEFRGLDVLSERTRW